MYELVLLKSINADMIDTLVKMDNATFPPEDWIKKDEAEMLYNAKQDSVTILYENKKSIGFVTAFLINENLVRKAIEKDTPIYQLLDSINLSDEKNDAVYIHCFLILPEYRNKDLIYALYKGLGIWLKENANADFSVYAEAVSEEGINCLGRIDFKTIHTYEDTCLLQKNKVSSLIESLASVTENKDWLDNFYILPCL